ncbi:hypothetical protein [uncultured Nostoc sp.]|uniref:hypothetical protein n=1 Tax=uncultured Nostoc sp. TaxID=340711 RepID=UPI0035CBE41A
MGISDWASGIGHWALGIGQNSSVSVSGAFSPFRVPRQASKEVRFPTQHFWKALGIEHGE